MRCGLHCVRFCDLRTKQCAGAPGSQAATKSIADALAGGPLTRRKVHAFARHPSRSRLGAPRARPPNDALVLDPHVPKPPGPANTRAQKEAPGPVGLRGDLQVEDPQSARLGTRTQLPAG